MSSTSLVDWVKPRRSEAIARLRSNGLGLVTALVVTNLLPLPSPWDAFKFVWRTWLTNRRGQGEEGLRWLLCLGELLLYTLLSFNILQAVYALCYPPPPLQIPPTPAKTKPLAAMSPPQRKLGLTPNSTPQPQKSFSSSQMFYSSTPTSTPSRILQYSLATPGPDTSINSSFSSSLAASPSPINYGNLNLGGSGSPLAAYRGKRRKAAGRAFDGEVLARLTQSTAPESSDDGDNDD